MTRTDLSSELESAYAREFRIIAEQLALQAAVPAESELRRLLTAWCDHDLAHARRLGRRLIRLDLRPPTAEVLVRLLLALSPARSDAGTPAEVLHSLRAENIGHYQQILLLCEGRDVVTQDLIIEILSQEQSDAESLLNLDGAHLFELAPQPDQDGSRK